MRARRDLGDIVEGRMAVAEALGRVIFGGALPQDHAAISRLGRAERVLFGGLLEAAAGLWPQPRSVAP